MILVWATQTEHTLRLISTADSSVYIESTADSSVYRQQQTVYDQLTGSNVYTRQTGSVYWCLTALSAQTDYIQCWCQDLVLGLETKTET